MLEASRIGRRAPGRPEWLLKDISVSIHPGERWAVIGPTGAGKSLLLRSLALLDILDEGEVRWEGEPVRPAFVPFFRSQVAYLLQRPTLGAGTVEQSLRAPFALGVHRHQQFDRERIVVQLATLGRGPDFLSSSTSNLSGGERQIAALLRVLQLQPAVLLLDEPTAALDAATGLAVEQLIEQWVANSPERRALIWISHDREQVARVAQKSIVLERGHVMETVK